MTLRTGATLTILLVVAGNASAGDWRLFRRSSGPGTGWTYYGLDGGPTVVDPPCTSKGCGVAPPVTNRALWPGSNPGVPVYTPVPGMFNTSDLYRGYPYPSLGWFGPLTPSPRPRVTSVGVSPN